MRNFYTKEYIIKLFSFILVVILFYKCPFYCITGFPCPSCGMTRAFLSCLRLNFIQAFNYHPLFLIIGLELIYLFIPEKYHLNKKIDAFIGIFILVLLLAVWLYRQF